MEQELAELKAELDALKTRRRTGWLMERRTEEIRNLVSDVLADADTRASLLENGVSAGYDDGFFIASPDGEFVLEISGRVQMRYVWSHQDDSEEDDDRSGFEMRRVKLGFDGTLPPGVDFSFTGAFDRDEGVAELEDATIEFSLEEGTRIRLGRYRSPLQREYDVSSKRQLLVERSLIARAFKQDRTTGAGLKHEAESFRVALAFMDSDPGFIGDQGWQTSVRGELLLAGEWKQLKDFTSFPDDDPVAALGAGVLYRQDDLADPDESDFNLLRWTADVSIEFGGANLFAAVIGSHFDEDDEDRLDQYGFVVQGGVFIADDWELFAQYVWGEAAGEADELSLATIGFNRYVDEHNLKWTGDIGYALNEVGDLWESSGAGWREDTEGCDGQIVARLQVQLLF
ncbi:MAG: hypothetical protein JSV91_01080 [Phycisphaerales bacterium]|nr:MAG: hypothetical protein JSV91_01080 [Phycisphaerales bacterium]